jgi:thiamine transport system permease protein
MGRNSPGTRNLTIRKVLAFAVIFFLLSPFLVLLYKFPLHPQFDFSEFFWALKNTVLQAMLSALGSLAIGIWAAFGLMAVKPKLRRLLQVICLAPNFLPPLFSLLVAFYWVDPFPVGIIGIAFIHSLINFGLVAVSLARSVETKLGGMAELAQIEGSSRARFLKRVFVPLLKTDLMELFIFVFSICFASFAIPLIVGGGRGTTLEVLIYEKIRLSMDWGGAVLISILQLLILAVLSWVLVWRGLGDRSISGPSRQMRWLGAPSGALMVGFFGFLFLVGYLDSVISGFRAFSQLSEWKWGLLLAFGGTLFVGLSTGAGILLLLSVVTMLMGYPIIRRFLRSYIAPSTTLTGFAFLVAGPNEGFFSYFKIPLSLSLLFVGTLYRMGWESEVKRLSGQWATAEIMGASAWQGFRRILWPQVQDRALMLAGLAAAWACGDFGLSRILAYHDMTLALMTETLMSTYRLNLASLLSVGILFCGLLCFSIFWGFGYVSRRKSA